MGIAVQRNTRANRANNKVESPQPANNDKQALGAGRLLEFPKKALPSKSKLTPEAVAARNELIEGHIDAAQKIATTIMKQWGARLPKGEVQSLANVALCEAAARFDENRGAKFVTYLYFYVKGQLGVAISSSVAAQSTAALTYVPGEASATPEEALNIRRGLDGMQTKFSRLDPFERAVASDLVMGDECGVGELAAKCGVARETASRTKTAVTLELLGAYKAA